MHQGSTLKLIPFLSPPDFWMTISPTLQIEPCCSDLDLLCAEVTWDMSKQADGSLNGVHLVADVDGSTIVVGSENRSRALPSEIGFQGRRDPTPATNHGDAETKIHGRPISYINRLTILTRTICTVVAASCSKNQNMRYPCEGTEQIFENPTENILVKHPHKTHDMSSVLAELLDMADLPALSSYNRAHDDEYFRNKQNIVQESLHPSITPHIVVTLAEESWDDYYTPWQNRVSTQQPESLMVPTDSISMMTRRYPWNHVDSRYLSQCHQEFHHFTQSTHGKKRVFSLKKFNQFIDTAANERLIMYHVVKAMQRNQCKAAAFAASVIAASLRRRYDTWDILSIEKPFQWSDPAEPILCSYRRLLGSHIIDSPNPLTTPHIVINTPPPQDPWIAFLNATQDPQNACFGRYLVVPSRPVIYINMSETQEWDESYYHDDTMPQDDADRSESLSFLSLPPTPEPESSFTALSDDHKDLTSDYLSAHGVFIEDGQIEEGQRILDCDLHSLLCLSTTSKEHIPRAFSKVESSMHGVTAHSVLEMEIGGCDLDEDGPPPFDEWYQSNATPVQSIAIEVGG